jgi:hypothetical protein
MLKVAFTDLIVECRLLKPINIGKLRKSELFRFSEKYKSMKVATGSLKGR